MFNSMRLGKLFGIDLFVHGTFWLLPLFVLFSGAMAGDVSGAAFQVVVLFALFGCVALHEVGHALAARWYGIETKDITLYPVGGVARLERMPERPWQEIVIAIAGPAVNVAIAAGLIAGIALANVPAPGIDSLGDNLGTLFVWQVLGANIFLVAFNLIPAFPMDGGRVLRAALSLGMPRVDATRTAVGVGSVFALLFVLVGLGLVSVPTPLIDIHGPSISLLLVGGVVFLLGQAELAAVRVQEARKRWPEGFEDYFAGPPADVHPHDAFTGWRWDPTRRMWSEWRNGVLVREMYQT